MNKITINRNTQSNAISVKTSQVITETWSVMKDIFQAETLRVSNDILDILNDEKHYHWWYVMCSVILNYIRTEGNPWEDTLTLGDLHYDASRSTDNI